MSDSISKAIYEKKVKARACGLLIENNEILMLRHRGIGTDGYIWSPPGGGIDFTEDAPGAVLKEFKEETGLQVAVEEFLFVNEYRDEKHHAIELFFKVRRLEGTVSLGKDPEVPDDEQILDKIDWLSIETIKSMNPNNLHNIFRHITALDELLELNGFFNFAQISIK
ncbi:NUDIX domain-containing protein [Marinoscillum furvescens]|uniref:ADP-ribose pyrophosphatase YjhB (NUDIX family) n=1 Tax=Marinoscillum furvescens DSM 4134 TaxID=1122208 RepID=A0A3D9L4E7_MARFU|nr:NUDIX hydrolase [Marinoscillum furvescens]RED97507.1 ADP-ribose pyrophosphatase YjhB (NUDIX family) [Marinoscillum furvescens DSM 4134]